jgi:hypothetical protein
MPKMRTIADALEEYGFKDSAYLKANNQRMAKYHSELPNIYCGWETFPTAPIHRFVPWDEILKVNQEIRISKQFRTMKPYEGKKISSLRLVYNSLKKHNPQHSHSNELEFQHILLSFSDFSEDSLRQTRVGDVQTFDFGSIYRILDIKKDIGYFVLCKDKDFKSTGKSSLKRTQLICCHASLFMWVDLVTLA